MVAQASLPAHAEDAGDVGWIPGLGRTPGEGNGNPLQYSCLRSPMDRRAWWATVHGVAKVSDTTEQLSMNVKERKGVCPTEILN